MEIELVWFVVTLCAAGAIAGITSGLFGNGGGFVVVPALSIVFPFFVPDSDEIVKVAIGTSLASIVVSSLRSVIAHKAKGAVDFAVLKSWSVWIVLGVIGGLLIADNTSAGGLKIVFAAGVLLYSIYFLFPDFVVRPGMYFSMPKGIGKATLAFVLGGFSALLGIGGGTPTVITMVMCRRTIQQAVATAAGVGFLIGLPGALGFLFMRHSETAALPVGTVGYVNIPALIAISIGSIMTAPIGANMAHNFSEKMLKRLFGIYLIIVSLGMFYKALQSFHYQRNLFMTYNPARRLFLGGSLAATAAGATGIITPAALAAGTSVAAPHVMYGPQAGIAKLNANENPYGPSPAALKAIAEASSTGGAYYAYQAGMYLTDMIAEEYGLKKENVAITAGSSLILAFAAYAATSKGKILGPDLFWDTTSKAPISQGGPDIVRVPNTADLDIDLDALYNAIDDNIAMVHICNPNNPTGKVLDTKKLQDFCIKASKKTLVLVDEAYNELISDGPAHSMIPLINQGHNIIVARTFSKIYGLAGMRVGYMLGSEENISFINQYGLGGYSINQAGLAAAIASFKDEAFKDFSRDKVMEAKDMIMSAVKANGLTALPSATNFVFVNLGDNGDANAFRAAMEKENVLIRGQYRTYKPWSRVSTGKIEDVKMYVDAMPKALEAMYRA